MAVVVPELGGTVLRSTVRETPGSEKFPGGGRSRENLGAEIRTVPVDTWVWDRPSSHGGRTEGGIPDTGLLRKGFLIVSLPPPGHWVWVSDCDSGVTGRTLWGVPGSVSEGLESRL